MANQAGRDAYREVLIRALRQHAAILDNPFRSFVPPGHMNNFANASFEAAGLSARNQGFVGRLVDDLCADGSIRRIGLAGREFQVMPHHVGLDELEARLRTLAAGRISAPESQLRYLLDALDKATAAVKAALNR